MPSFASGTYWPLYHCKAQLNFNFNPPTLASSDKLQLQLQIQLQFQLQLLAKLELGTAPPQLVGTFVNATCDLVTDVIPPVTTDTKCKL